MAIAAGSWHSVALRSDGTVDTNEYLQTIYPILLPRPRLPLRTAVENATVVLVVDVSVSMNAKDVKPTRLEAAKGDAARMALEAKLVDRVASVAARLDREFPGRYAATKATLLAHIARARDMIAAAGRPAAAEGRRP